ncbi:MAG: 16S rRNA (uracil(1498)-N(3))-methyltransferase [Crocinitomicaceae bacterium]|nr:16S rRNA (uracil(1498)-N(3))-methyltransferase [Crocinitomicaceae bacterium]
MNYFYQEFQENDQVVELSEEESKHIHKVLRKKEGDVIGMLNGKGLQAEGKIIGFTGKKISVQLQNLCFEENDPSGNLTIAIAPTKNMDRFEFFLEKATEIGLGKVVPILSSNSERKVVKEERLEKILVSAMKQSKRLYLPELKELTKFETFLDQDNSECKFIAHCEEEEKRNFVKELDPSKKTTILIGPEGDFSINEIKLALQKGYIPVSLGESRLRTETAGIYASAAFNMK